MTRQKPSELNIRLFGMIIDDCQEDKSLENKFNPIINICTPYIHDTYTTSGTCNTVL